MTEPVRVLHFADLHIGVESFGRVDPETGINGRVLDFLRSLDKVVDYAQEHDADLAIFAGDAFRSHSPSPTYQREFARRIKRLAAHCPVVLLVGNHDMPAMVQKASSMDIYRALEVPNVIVGRTDKLHTIETQRGPVQVATAPYPMRQRLLAREDSRGKSILEIDKALEAEFTGVLTNLAQDAARSPETPSILAGHFSVSEAEPGSEKHVMIGRDVAVLKPAVADPAWDYVALGHVHRHQNLTEGERDAPPVVYSGSLERIDFGEEREEKGFCWAKVARGEADWEFVRLPARPFVTVTVDVRVRDDPTAAVLAAIEQHDIGGAIVRVLIQATVAAETDLRDREIEQALEEAYYVAAIRKDVERPARSRLGGESPETLTAVQLLERYLLAQETDEERTAVLLGRFREIMDSAA
jgi:exonuclease SbcD